VGLSTITFKILHSLPLDAKVRLRGSHSLGKRIIPFSLSSSIQWHSQVRLLPISSASAIKASYKCILAYAARIMKGETHVKEFYLKKARSIIISIPFSVKYKLTFLKIILIQAVVFHRIACCKSTPMNIAEASEVFRFSSVRYKIGIGMKRLILVNYRLPAFYGRSHY
jgi:hypothetical protein